MTLPAEVSNWRPVVKKNKNKTDCNSEQLLSKIFTKGHSYTNLGEHEAPMFLLGRGRGPVML